MSRHEPIVYALCLCLIVFMALRLYLAFIYEINWDEFLNLSMVYDFSRGDLREPLQTAFVHGFHWVSAVSVNEVDQIIAARMVMFACASLTIFFIVGIAKRFMPLHAALFAGVCFAVHTYVVRQGATFRTDTMTACVLMAALWIILTRPVRARWALVAGGLIGLAGMLTIKAIFYVPTIAAILLLQLFGPDSRSVAFRYGTSVAIVALGSFGLIFGLHWLSIEQPASVFAFLDRTTGKTLGTDSNHMLTRFFIWGVKTNLIFWVAAVAGFFYSLWKFVTGHGRLNAAILLCLATPLVCLLVYSESYPYFYAFILPPVAVLCGVALGAFNPMWGLRVAFAGTIALGLLFAQALPGLFMQHNRAQHLTLDVVHKMFLEPVPYIDRTSMVSSFPKKGLFLSVWGMTDYYKQGEPLIANTIHADQPNFIIANRHMLEFENLVPERAGRKHAGFLLPDILALRENYIPHWGRIYVAGKQINFGTVGSAEKIEIVIEGDYTVEAPAPITLGDQRFEPGESVRLSKGEYSISSEAPGLVTLRWGKDLYRPNFQPPSGKLFTSF